MTTRSVLSTAALFASILFAGCADLADDSDRLGSEEQAATAAPATICSTVGATKVTSAGALATAYAQGKRNFAGSTLRAANLRYLDLRGASFNSTDFTGADLTNAKLDNTNFACTVLTNAKLGGTLLRTPGLVSGRIAGTPAIGQVVNGYLIAPGVNLRGADFSGLTITPAFLSGADLTDANLSRANLTAADLRDAGLAGANLSFAKLTRANLSGADLSKATLASAAIADTDLTNATFDGTTSGLLQGTPRLTAPYVVRAGYLMGPYVSLKGARLGGNLSDVNLTGVISATSPGRRPSPPTGACSPATSSGRAPT